MVQLLGSPMKSHINDVPCIGDRCPILHYERWAQRAQSGPWGKALGWLEQPVVEKDAESCGDSFHLVI